MILIQAFMLKLIRAERAEPKVDPQQQQTGLTEPTGSPRKVLSKDDGLKQHLSPEAMASSPNSTVEHGLAEASTTIAAAQSQTTFNDQVHSQNLTIHNGISPVEYLVEQTRLQTQLQSLRNDLDTLVCYVHMQFRRSAHGYGTQDILKQGCNHNHGVGPWAPSNFDPYEYGSDLNNNNMQPENDCGMDGDDAGWDADWYDQRPEEDQTWYQERAQTDIAGINAWRRSFPVGTAPPSAASPLPSISLSQTPLPPLPSSPPPPLPLSRVHSPKVVAEPFSLPTAVASASGGCGINGREPSAVKDMRLPEEQNVDNRDGGPVVLSAQEEERHSHKTAPPLSDSDGSSTRNHHHHHHHNRNHHTDADTQQDS